MPEEIPDKELNELKEDIARLREEIAALAAGLKASPDAKPAGAQNEDSRGANGHENKEEDHGAWEDLLRKLDSSRGQGEKVIRSLAAEVERHPLASVIAAFGLGYIIASLWRKEGKQ